MQLILGEGKVSLFSRTGDDIAAAFPDLVENVFGEAVLDGELLVGARFRAGAVQRPAAAAQPQGRDGQALQDDFPAFIRVYDMLFDGARGYPRPALAERRARLEAWFAANPQTRLDLSAVAAVQGLGANWPKSAARAPPSMATKASC